MEKYTLSNSNIDLACEKVGEFLASSSVERREALRIRFIFEEALLEYQARFGEENAFTLNLKKRFSTIKIEISVAGEAFDPFAKEDQEMDISQSLLSRLGLAPTWSYKNRKNYIVFLSKRSSTSGTKKMCAAIVLALVAGFLMNLLPENISGGINEYLLTPLINAFMGLLSAVSGPLIFLAVLDSICSMGNLETLGRVGTKTIKVIILYATIIAISMTAMVLPFFQIKREGDGGSNSLQILDLIYDIVPSNLFEPFIVGNALQIIFIAVMAGLAMIVVSSRVNAVLSLVEQLNAIVQTMMSGLTSLLPYLIFVLFTNMISGGQLEILLDSWKMVAMIVVLCIVSYAINILYISVRRRVSPMLIFKKAWPTCFIAFTTASSAAAFAMNVHDAEKKLGIDKKLVAFATPIGQVLFMPGYLAMLVSIEMCLAENCNIPITIAWIISGLITNILVSFAVPPITGGAILGYSIVFEQLSIPLEVMGVAIAVSAITDFIGTALNVSGWQLNLIDVADSLNMLDKKVLRKK